MIAQTAGQGFDISVWQMLAGLLCGARVEIVPDAVAHDPQALLEHVRATGITVLESVPSLIQGLLDAEPVPLPGLRWLLPTGEAMPPALARRWLERYPHVPLVNAYGPAECSDDVALHRIETAPGEDEALLPIGRPTDNNRLYVLDDDLSLLPAGAMGELHAAGIGRRPRLSGRSRPHRRALRARPVRRWRPALPHRRPRPLERAGPARLSGRGDQQVKIRGFRIELGEIEARLGQHRGRARGRGRGGGDGSRPAARGLCRARRAAATTGLPQRLRAYLRERLPDYMVPARLALLDRLPLNANGKLDRAALPEIGWEARPPRGRRAPSWSAGWPRSGPRS